jgi:hypothetical protein
MQPREEWDPTGRHAMEQQFATSPQSAMEVDSDPTLGTAQVIGFVRPNRDERSKR